MIEAVKEAFDILNQITHGLGTSILAIIPISIGLSIVSKTVGLLCRGERTAYAPTQSEPLQADKPKVNLEKDTLDNDLKKYLNYDVKR